MVRIRPYPVIVNRLREWARRLKRDVLALYLAAHDPRVPWPAKVVAVAVAAYALSPIDLIPDFIPVLGYLDDLLIVPLGIWLAVRLVPPELMAEFRARASDVEHPPALGRWGAAFVIGLWVLGAAVTAVWFVRIIRSH